MRHRSWRGIPHSVLTVTTVSAGPHGADPAWAEWLAGLSTGESQLAEIGAEHDAAREVISRYNADLQPFALWLRGFDLERLRLQAKSPLAQELNLVSHGAGDLARDQRVGIGAEQADRLVETAKASSTRPSWATARP
jgi:hypothetical protein